MKSVIFLISLFLGSAAFAQNTHGDVIIRHRGTWSQVLPPPTDLKDCRARIQKAICWVEPFSNDDEQAGERERPCLAGGEKFATAFEGHFDRSPDFIKQMYCHVDKLWIEKDFYATAYASPVMVNDVMVGGGVGVRQEILESNMPFDAWISWKEETSFGGPTKTSGKSLDLIHYKSNRNTKEFFFDYVMSHEFGHLFDFANNLNQISDCRWERQPDGTYKQIGDCKPLANSWTEISWADVQTPKAEYIYPYRDELCFYFCNGKFISPDHAADLFAGLAQTNFHSTYASSGMMEDWAEAFALTISHDILGLNYGLEIRGRYFDLSQHFYSPMMEPKRSYVQKFIAGPKKYPGQ